MLSMMSSNRDDLKTVRSPQTIRWPVRVIGLLLFLQACMLSAISIYFAGQISWDREWEDIMLSMTTLDVIMWVATIVPLVLLLLFTSIGFLLYRRFAWLFAMTLQGLILLRCLFIYFATHSHLQRSPWIHLVMLYSIILVLYLNTSDIRLAFTAHPADESP